MEAMMTDTRTEARDAAQHEQRQQQEQSREKTVLKKATQKEGLAMPDPRFPLGHARNPVPPVPLPEHDFAVKLFRKEGIPVPTDFKHNYLK
jgi:hypothetical protein